MKTRNLIPAFLIAIAFISFQQPVFSQTKDDTFQAADQGMFGDHCNMAVATASKNDSYVSPKLRYYQFSFCPDGNLTVRNPYNGYMASGFWAADKGGTAKIFVNPSAETVYGDDFSWLSNEWQVVEYSPTALELERWDYSGDTPALYRVRFDQRM